MTSQPRARHRSTAQVGRRRGVVALTGVVGLAVAAVAAIALSTNGSDPIATGSPSPSSTATPTQQTQPIAPVEPVGPAEPTAPATPTAPTAPVTATTTTTTPVAPSSAPVTTAAATATPTPIVTATSPTTPKPTLPPPGLEEQPNPIGTPPKPPKGGAGLYRYAEVQRGNRPVTFSPCRPIHYVIRKAPSVQQSESLVTQAVAAVSQATGLKFIFDGPTTEAPQISRAPYQPKRYGDRWAPVLVAWATPKEVPNFKGEAVGETSTAVASNNIGDKAIATGQVTLDTDALRKMIALGPKGIAQARAVILHELGHLVGLAHVDAQSQLMYPQLRPQVTSLGVGDRTGLAAMGAGPCQPKL